MVLGCDRRQRCEGRNRGQDPIGVVRVQPYALDLSGGQWRPFVPNGVGDTHPTEVVHQPGPAYRPGVRAEFGGRGYIPFETTDLASGVWTPSTSYDLPAKPRHGTVLPVTQAEYDRLLSTYQPDQIVKSVEDIKVDTRIGEAPVLPATANKA